MNRINVGKGGEEQAVRYLRERGYRILERNYRYHNKEVDIIAQKDDTIVFVEVKARTNRSFGDGMEAVNFHKKSNIIYVARYYLNEKELYDHTIRFDVASVNKNSLVYIENAFQL